MADDETTTTTESTTETTTEAQNQEQNTQETATTTVVSSEASIPAAEKQGEVAIDKGATADVVGDTNQEAPVDPIEQAKQDALANHAASEASQPETTTSPSSQSDTAEE